MTTPNLGANADDCPPGSYCPEGSDFPTPCPEGTYSNAYNLHAEIQCLNCTGGYYCNETGLTVVTGPCLPGYYCPVGSKRADEVPCTEGYYCELATLDPAPCPNGTYSNITLLSDISQCTDCTPGYYCNGLGLVEVSGPCKAGYYCPLGSSLETEIICPEGQHCPQGSATPKDCPPGSYTDSQGESSCIECPEGYYCIPENVIPGDPSSVMVSCPEGFYCPNGTSYDWQSCPSGTYSNVRGLAEAVQCTPCDAGWYCQGNNLTSPTGQCDSGFWCLSGADRANPYMVNGSQCPTNTVHPIIGGICPPGAECIVGTSTPVACLAGYYQDLTTQNDCKDCPAGYWCYANTTDYTPNVCPAGYYCELNTPDPLYTPCPNGTFNNVTGRPSLADCLPCSPGMYCHGPGNAYPTGECAEGWYCTNGSADAMTTSDGGECQPGTYCPQGSYEPIPCTAGSFCNISGLALPVALCDPGYYCPIGSVLPTEVDCPVGHFCPQGSDIPEPCRNGTYGPGTRLTSQADCTPCDAGSYCNETGASSVSGDCDPGYYCPPGQTSPTPFDYPCTAGHFCLTKSPLPTICPSGTYQNELGKYDCKTCPEGYFCDNSFGPVTDLSNSSCPTGHYCLSGTTFSTQYPCPPSTFNNLTRKVSADQCMDCPPKYYCLGGLGEPHGFCAPGYYCNGSQSQVNPPDFICPIGNYCPEGSDRPTPCPEGTMSNGLGNTNFSDCDPCKPGRYCTPLSSQNGISLPCSAGFICLIGSNVPNPTDTVKGYICPVGHKCLEGAVVETPCDKGTYQPQTGQGACLSCPAGTTCPDQGMNETVICPPGFYCPNGTYTNGMPCPLGTFNQHTGLSVQEDCQLCPSGQFCDETGLVAPAGNCSAGYLCIEGAVHPGPNDGVNGLCPIGHYCEEGTLNATACPMGYMNPNVGGESVADCMPCLPGQFCGETGLSSPSGLCRERYYCPDSEPTQVSKPTSFACPAGYYCPNGTGLPIACEPGTYQPNQGSIDCLPCPARYYCLKNSSTPEICPRYSYCPNGTVTPILCPDGTYTENSTVGLSDASQCEQCPAGKYCVDGTATGDCQAGHWCKKGNAIPNPYGNDTNEGELCPYGFYCEAGCISPRACPPGRVINKVGATGPHECTICPPGRICPENATISEPCLPGYYCPGAGVITACPRRTYNEMSGGMNLTDCLPCPAGYFCDWEAMANYSISPCPPGWYCTEATDAPDPCPPGTYRGEEAAGSIAECHTCPAGYYCPETNATLEGTQCDEGYFCPPGSQNQTICQAGYYCNRSMTQEPCLCGYYCPEASSSPQPCPPGHYCGGEDSSSVCDNSVIGAIEPIKCPLGHREMDGSPRWSFGDTCEICRSGYYGNHPERAECRPCRAGVVCKEGAITDQPMGNDTQASFEYTHSYPCPHGYYCPENSSFPTPCPEGTFNPSEYKGSVQDCLPCGVDHFNHLYAQTGCFPCGGEAKQPDIGQPTCLCTGAGRDFQHSDRQCPCKAGYNILQGRETDCVKDVYDICLEGTTRTQSGLCYDDDQWRTHCTENVCGGADAYIGFDALLGLCKCKVDDLELICDLECRIAQRMRIKLVCPQRPEPSYIVVSNSDNSHRYEIPSLNLRSCINYRNAISDDQCDGRENTEIPIHFTVMEPAGFVGVYDPNPASIQQILEDNSKGNFTGNYSGGEVGANRRRLLTTTNLPAGTFTGIQNPTVCLKYGETMFFYVSNDNYPVYDRDNLYNTNQAFDYGGFRELAEAQSQISTATTLFSYRFNDPGVYSFHHSTDTNKKMYVRVMAEFAQCAEDGPFFPTTPRSVIQNGMSIDQDILKAPDWALILILLGAALMCMVILVIALILFRKYGWMKTSYIFPRYRRLAEKYNFDDYASKGSTVHPVKKYHRNLEALEHVAGGGGTSDPNAVNAILDAQGVEVKGDEFWDYDAQVDLEAFNAATMYDTLAKQSRDITQNLGKQKDEAKSMYQKVNHQTESLKGLWAAKLNLKGRASMATQEDIAKYEVKLEELEIELERRKELGTRFEAILQRQQNLIEDDELDREKHQVNYEAALREGQRQLNEHSERLQRGQILKDGELDTQQHARLCGRVGHLIQRMSNEINEECQRLGAWGVLGQGTGGTLVFNNSSDPIERDQLLGPDQSILAPDVVHLNPVTGLIEPNAGATMMLGNGSLIMVPPGCFVHPQTGKVLPINGNVAYDPVTSRLVFTTDSATGEACRSDDPLIPYVPYPVNPTTSLPVVTKIKPLERKSDMKYCAPVPDPITGLHCPIVGATIDPSNGAVLPVAGTHTDPITGLPIPIEIGSLMIDPVSEQPVPILGVTLDAHSGDVVPVGGTRSGSHSDIPIVPGDTFVEPLSGKVVRVNTGFLNNNEVVPSAGGYMALLEANVLACEARVTDALREYKDAINSVHNKDEGTSLNTRHEQNVLDTALRELSKARTRMKTYWIRSGQDLQRRRERANILSATGGSPGMYEFTLTGQLLPVLIGTTMVDPDGSGQDVAILGAEKDRFSGKIRPLGGTTEDPEGRGLVPIMLGEMAVDPVTGDLSPITGVRVSNETQTVVPVTLASGGHKKKKAPLGATAMLEEEVVARRSYWRRQRQREDELTEKEFLLSLKLITDLEGITSNMVEKALNDILEKSAELGEASKRETTRKSDSEQEFASVFPPEVVSVLTYGDMPEREHEEAHQTAHKKFVEVIRKFFNKLQAEEEKYKDRLSELEGAMNPDAEHVVKQRYMQAKQRLQGELQDQIMGRVEALDEEHSGLEYCRQRSELLCLEAKVVLMRSSVLAGDYDAKVPGVYGECDLSSSSSESELIPLLKQLIEMLSTGGPFVLSTELLQVLQGRPGVNVAQIQQQMEAAQATGGLTPAPGGFTGQVTQVGVNPMAQGPNVITTVPLQRSADGGTTKTDYTIIDQNALKAPTENESESDIKERQKQLLDKQTFEAAKLENSLKDNEIQSINGLVQDYEKRKDETIKSTQEELKKKLSEAQTQEEKERLLMEYAHQLQRSNDKLDAEKQRQMANLRKKLLDERRQKKKELHRNHITEAKSLGLPADTVPDMYIPTHDELDHDLKLLTQQQEKLLAEMRLAAAQQNDNVDIDPEMEERIRALRLQSPGAEDLINDLKSKINTSNSRAINMKDKLRARKERHRSAKKVSDEELAGLNEDEKQELLATLQNQCEATRMKEEQALLMTLQSLEQDDHRREEERRLRDLLKDKSAEERDRLLAQYDAETLAMEQALDNQKASQQDKLLAKLAARKRMKEELAKEKAVNKELDRITQKQASRSGDDDSAEVISNISKHLNTASLTPEQEKLHEAQIDEQATLVTSQKEQERLMNQTLDTELAKSSRQVDDQMEEQKKLALDSHKAKFDREMLLHGKNLSKDEYERLMALHEQEARNLQRNMENEKARQKQALADRVAERRRKKQAQISEKSAAELAKQLAAQQQQRDALNQQIERKVAESTLKESVKDKDGEQVENMVYTVLRQRHIKEAVHLEEQLARELDAAKADTRATVAEERQQQREKLTASHEQELIDLVANAGTLKSSELAQKKEELKRRQQREIAEFDSLTPQMIATAERDTARHLQAKHTNSRLELKEKQLRELADAMKIYTPEEKLQEEYAERAKQAAEEAKRYREETLRKMNDNLKHMKDEAEKKEGERKRKLVNQMKQLEQDLEAERKRDEERERERQAERERIRRQQLEEREKREKADIDKMNISEDEKEKLLREHEENMKRFDSQLKDEQQRSSEALKAKLEARRNKKRATEIAQIEKNNQLQTEEDIKQEMDEKIAEERRAAERASSGDQPSGFAPFTPTGNAEQDWVNMLMASPLFKQINDLEAMMDKSAGGTGAAGSGPSKVQGADYSRAYLDIKDAQWSCSGDLVPVDLNDITPHQFVVYRFGVFVSRVLRQLINAPEVTLLLASNLPSNNYNNNAFRNSFFYEHARKILFIRRERMDSIGDFVVVILHCLAHISVDDLTDDANPMFLRQFYKSLRVVCQDMFFSRSHTKPTSSALIGGSPTNGRTALETAFKHTRSSDEKSNVVGELVDVKVEETMERDFSHDALSSRLRGYEKMTSNAKLRHLLGGQGGINNQSNFVAGRLAELKGEKPLETVKSPSNMKPKNETIRSQKDLLKAQLRELQSKGDNLNSELVQVMKSESELSEGVQKLTGTREEARITELQSQLQSTTQKKTDLLKRITHLESDIAKKERELSK
ncbi:unnamed protein product [Owenia fusiformis]|uniref:Tyrosine-protein kinase ephrin type A/B receptor-like domain-containing protein n=1 Tax=Owenia fusiformis TaxID=6347 RepID=A0A8S4PAE8_OWEFU|nr:unnamed protein product [Owenia fusiformis]